jgi:hypothetical protein
LQYSTSHVFRRLSGKTAIQDVVRAYPDRASLGVDQWLELKPAWKEGISTYPGRATAEFKTWVRVAKDGNNSRNRDFEICKL